MFDYAAKYFQKTKKAEKRIIIYENKKVTTKKKQNL